MVLWLWSYALNVFLYTSRVNLKMRLSPVILELGLRKTQSFKSHDYIDVIVFEKLRFQNFFVNNTETKCRLFQIPSVWGFRKTPAFSWPITCSVHGRSNRKIQFLWGSVKAALDVDDMHLTYQVFICSYILAWACLISCSHVIASVGNFWGRFNHLWWYSSSRI